MKRLREPYLPETVKQALASAKRLRKQLSNAAKASSRGDKLWLRLNIMHSSVCDVAAELGQTALNDARKEAER